MRLLRFRTKRNADPHREGAELSTLQKDVLQYYGLEKQSIEADYDTRKAVHTLMTIGYMDFDDNEVLILTERGDRLMRGVRMPELG